MAFEPGTGPVALRRLAASGLAVAEGRTVFVSSHLSVCAYIPRHEWRGEEATLSASALQLITGQMTQRLPARHLLILSKNTSVESIFVLTSECSVADLVAALPIGGAPLMLLRPLARWRTAVAIGEGVGVLVLGNAAHLIAIGATVSTYARDPGLTIAHTYLGSLLTFLGTCAAGVAFAAVLLSKRTPQPAIG